MEITIDSMHFGETATVQMDTDCAVHKHDSWVPMNEHHVQPKQFGGKTEQSNLIRVCTNGHYEIHAYFQLLEQYKGYIPNNIRAHFGIKVRNYARKGWELSGKPTHGGGE